MKLESLVISALLSANGGLLLIAGYFLKQFIGDVRSFRKEYERFATATRVRLALLEGKHGIYNPEVVT